MIQSIPKVYKKIQMRSKLEARVARVLDKLKIKWLYEPQRFFFEGGITYLPDFFLPEILDAGAWLEVKGVWTEEARLKAEMLAREDERRPVCIIQPFETREDLCSNKWHEYPCSGLWHRDGSPEERGVYAFGWGFREQPAVRPSEGIWFDYSSSGSEQFSQKLLLPEERAATLREQIRSRARPACYARTFGGRR